MITRIQIVLWGYLGERMSIKENQEGFLYVQFRILKMTSVVCISESKLKIYFLFNHYKFRIPLTYIYQHNKVVFEKCM